MQIFLLPTLVYFVWCHRVCVSPHKLVVLWRSVFSEMNIVKIQVMRLQELCHRWVKEWQMLKLVTRWLLNQAIISYLITSLFHQCQSLPCYEMSENEEFTYPIWVILTCQAFILLLFNELLGSITIELARNFNKVITDNLESIF